ncbi:MAG: hypothetical protein WCX31_14955 [Salinivirgaceae bacterium]|jgi:hypothetical protein
MKTITLFAILSIVGFQVSAQKSDIKTAPVLSDLENILSAVVKMPIFQITKDGSPVYHFEPTPVDFYTNFSINGQFPDTISVKDMASVALSAVKALAQKTQELSENQKLLEQTVQRLNETTEQAYKLAMQANEIQVTLTNLQIKLTESEAKINALEMQMKQK